MASLFDQLNAFAAAQGKHTLVDLSHPSGAMLVWVMPSEPNPMQALLSAAVRLQMRRGGEGAGVTIRKLDIFTKDGTHYWSLASADGTSLIDEGFAHSQEQAESALAAAFAASKKVSPPAH